MRGCQYLLHLFPICARPSNTPPSLRYNKGNSQDWQNSPEKDLHHATTTEYTTNHRGDTMLMGGGTHARVRGTHHPESTRLELLCAYTLPSSVFVCTPPQEGSRSHEV